MIEFWFIILKLLISLITIVPVFRLMGRNSMSENTPLDVTNIIILGGTVSIIATGNQYSVLDLVGIIILWCLMVYLLDLAKMVIPFVERLIDGRPTIIIRNGKVNEDILFRERITHEELMDMLREQQVYSIHDVKIAWLEVSGRISVKTKKGGGDNG